MKSKPYPHPQTPDEGLTRRQFVKTAAWSVSGTALSGCGAGAGADAVAAPSANTGPTAGATGPANPGATAPGASTPSAPATPSAEPPTPTPDPVEPPAAVPLPAELGRSTGAMRFTLTTAIPQATTPFTLGHAFRRGDVPAGKTVAVSGLALQVVVKNRWPDGSMKLAILSGRAVLQPSVPVSHTLSVVDAAAAAAPVLGTAQLRLTGVKAEFTAGSWGSASFVGADWDAPVSTWVSGPEMSSWVYRKPFALAGVADAHLVAWLEVRLYADKRIELLPWAENGYLRVPNPSNRAATYTFALNGRTEFSGAIDLKHHQRVVLLAAQATSCGVPFDARVAVHHDGQYLQATELVPTYRPRLTPSSPAIARLPTSYAPLAAHGFVYDGDSMASGGYQSPIGLLPEHDVTYLTSDTTLSWQALMRNGFASGRYGIHYRDELTQLPLRFSDHPTYTIRSGQGFKDSGGGSNFTPVATGGNPPTWDVAHSPSVGYLAYLATGWRYFMEETQFAATANFLGNDKDIRAGTQGLVRTAVQAWQTRSCAWDWRTRVQALCITPDDDPLRPEFINTVESNITHFHATYVALPNNPWGWIKPGEDAYDRTIRLGASWQQDFVTAAFGYSLALGLPLSSTASSRLDAFFQWKARSVVMRLGPTTGFWFINAAPYTMVISPSNTPNYDNGTGPWYGTERAVYEATYSSPPSWLGSTEGQLAAEFLPGEFSFWGNLQPAIAYAVRFNVAGAAQAYSRVTDANNWPQLRDAFGSRPVWGVMPATPEPAWLAGKPANTWIEIAGTAGAGGAAVDAYSGMALDERTSEIIIASAGGHTDSNDNRVVSISLLSHAPAWTLRKAASDARPENVSHYPDGTPTSRHLYQHIHVVEQLDRVFHFGCRAAWGGPSFEFRNVDAFNLSTNQWDAKDSWPAVPAGQGYGVVRIRETGEVWTSTLARWSPVTRAWTNPITKGSAYIRWPVAYDSRRRQIFSLMLGDGQGYDLDRGVQAYRVPISGDSVFPVTLAASDALAQFIAERPAYAGMDYDPINDCFVFYSGLGAAVGRLYIVKPNDGNVWSVSVLPLATGSPLPSSGPSNLSGVNSRWRYVPALKGFVLLPRAAANLFFIRVVL